MGLSCPLPWPHKLRQTADGTLFTPHGRSEYAHPDAATAPASTRPEPGRFVTPRASYLAGYLIICGSKDRPAEVNGTARQEGPEVETSCPIAVCGIRYGGTRYISSYNESELSEPDAFHVFCFNVHRIKMFIFTPLGSDHPGCASGNALTNTGTCASTLVEHCSLSRIARPALYGPERQS